MTPEKVKQPDPNKISDILAAVEAKENEPKVNPELRDLLDSLSEDEFKELESSVKADGIRDPMIVWEETNEIVDGHNRFKIAKANNLVIPTPIKKSFPDIDAVKDWMIRNQLGRRNLSLERRKYYIGLLYNKMKGTAKEGEGEIADKIAKQVGGISGRTVRRLGEKAAGVDMIARVQGKLARSELLQGKSDLTDEEIRTVGKASNATVAKTVIEKIKTGKVAQQKAKEEAKTVQKAAAASPKVYSVVFTKPDFESPLSNAVKPNLDKEAIVYMYAADEHLATALELVRKWGLTYDASFVFATSVGYDGVYSKIKHVFMLAVTKGTMVGPKAGSEKDSVQSINGDDPQDAMIKLIEAYHPDAKKLDMRQKAATGWDSLPK